MEMSTRFLIIVGYLGFSFQGLVMAQTTTSYEFIVKYDCPNEAHISYNTNLGQRRITEQRALFSKIGERSDLLIKTIRPLHPALVHRMAQENESEEVVLQKSLARTKRGAAPVKDYGFTRKLIIEVEPLSNETPDEISQKLSEASDSLAGGCKIESIDFSGKGEFSAFPSDPRFSEQWALHNTGQSGGTPDADIDAPESWDITASDPQVVIAVLDTGVDMQHEDLVDNFWVNQAEKNGISGIDDDNNGYIDDFNGWDFVTSGSNCGAGEDCSVPDNNPDDLFGHGTWVAGFIAATANNGKGIAGTAYNARIMPIRQGFKTTTSAQFNFSDVPPAILYAVANGADIINMSFITSSSNNGFMDEVLFAHDQGVVLVASAGNNNSQALQYPASSPVVLAVAGTDRSDVRWSSSNYGSWVDLTAPAVQLLTTGLNNTYEFRDGTSFSNCFVAGVAAQIITLRPDLTNVEIELALRQGVDNIDALNPAYIGKLGTGRLNAQKAISLAMADQCPNDIKTSPGQCGCGVLDTDSDGDGVADCVDLCPTDPRKSLPGVTGCFYREDDSDRDGIEDARDGCANDTNKISPGQCGCGFSDADLNANGAADCLDPTTTLVPKAAILTPTKKGLTADLQKFTGKVEYIVTLSRKGVKPNVRRSTSSTLNFKKLSPGRWKVTYRVKVAGSSDESQSLVSAKASIKLKGK